VHTLPSRRLPAILAACAIGALALGACSSDDPSPASAPDTSAVASAVEGDVARQAGSITALNEGDLAGRVPVSELRTWGDLGLGTYEGLDGEMVVLDGEVWQIGIDGVPHHADDDLTSPFAQVTTFEPTDSFEVTGPTTCAELGTAIDAEVSTGADLVALRVTGELTALTLRSVPAQAPPYPPLQEVVADQQVTFDLGPLEGTLVGFRTGPALASVSPAGYHFHFLSDDDQHGGHVLSCTLERATVELDPVGQLDLVLR
jgi:acetolactate decarboxylase